MSFTKQFLHDVFISYASANNAAPDDHHPGLITALHDKLRIELQSLGLTDGLDLFFDQGDVGDSRPLPEQILTAARSSAVFVAVHSPAYDNSIDWCHREFHEFRAANEAWDQRLFLISLNRDSRPAENGVFKGMSRRYRSFYEERAQHWFTFSTLKPEAKNPAPRSMSFHDEVEDLAREIAPILRRLRDAAPLKRIFLTCASDQWKAAADDLKNEFTGPGFQIFRTSPWLDPEARRADAEGLIAAADLVIGIEEKPQGLTDESFVHRQEQLAITNRLKKPQLHWLPGDRHGFTPEETAALMERGDIRATGLQEFKKMVKSSLVDAVALQMISPSIDPRMIARAPAPPSEDGTPAPLVLLVCSQADEAVAFPEIATAIGSLQIGYDNHVDISPAGDTAAIEAWCASVKDRVTLFEPTAVMFLDGSCDRDWIDDRLRRYFVLQRDLPNRPPAAICECLPIPKSPLRRFRPAGRLKIFSHTDTAALRTFLLP